MRVTPRAGDVILRWCGCSFARTMSERRNRVVAFLRSGGLLVGKSTLYSGETKMNRTYVKGALLLVTASLLGCSADGQQNSVGQSNEALVGDRTVSAVAAGIGTLVNGTTSPTDQYYEGTFKLPSYQNLVSLKGRSEYDPNYNDSFTPAPTEYTGIVVRVQDLAPPFYYYPLPDPGAAAYTVTEVSATGTSTPGEIKWRFRARNNYTCTSNCSPPKIAFHVWGVVTGLTQAAVGTTIQAEASTSESGTTLANNGSAVHFPVGASRCYSGVDLTGVTGLQLRYASLAGNDVNLYIDGVPQVGGIDAGNFLVYATGGFSTFQTFSSPFQSSGVHTLCLVGASEGKTGAGIVNLDWFKLLNAPPSGCASNALPRVAATASSLEGANWPASAAIDDSLTTRWSSAFSDPQWLSIDLGAKSHISELWLRWETAYSSDFVIQVSDNGSAWSNALFEGRGFTGDVQHIQLDTAGRYVRIFSKTRATNYGVSLFNVDVVGDPNPNCH